jgi:hypothetical protein
MNELEEDLCQSSESFLSNLLNVKASRTSAAFCCSPPSSSAPSSDSSGGVEAAAKEYTLAGRAHQQLKSSRFSKFHYTQVGTFLTQYKIRESYKFLQMISVPPLDPAVPKPEGGLSIPACGEPLLVPQSFPQSIEAAIHKFANASSKAACVTVLDQYGKSVASLTYVKLLSKAHRVAYNLLNKTASRNDPGLKFGDRVSIWKRFS